jgi:hypothetical protein
VNATASCTCWRMSLRAIPPLATPPICLRLPSTMALLEHWAWLLTAYTTAHYRRIVLLANLMGVPYDRNCSSTGGKKHYWENGSGAS